MNKLKIYASIILALSVCIFTFTACKDDTPETIVETTSKKISTTQSNGYTYNDIIFTMEPVSEYVHVAPAVPTRQKIDKTQKQEETLSEKAEIKSTAKQNQSDKVENISKGINVLSKTSPVYRNNSASIVIIGTPSATYTIEFYETETKKAAYSGLETTKSDSSGIASWNFTIEDSCEPGNRKVIIREKNSDKYTQTSITVY